MFKVLILISFLTSSAFAQNMAKNERNASVLMPDGSSRYVGRCSLHEDYDKFYFTTTKTLQNTFEPNEKSDKYIEKVLAKFEPKLIKALFTQMRLYDIGSANDHVTVMKEIVDDFTVTSLKSMVFPDLDLIRFNVGVGGGNGGFTVFNKVTKASKVTYELMSETFDGDMNYCDRKVWLENK